MKPLREKCSGEKVWGNDAMKWHIHWPWYLRKRSYTKKLAGRNKTHGWPGGGLTESWKLAKALHHAAWLSQLLSWPVLSTRRKRRAGRNFGESESAARRKRSGLRKQNAKAVQLMAKAPTFARSAAESALRRKLSSKTAEMLAKKQLARRNSGGAKLQKTAPAGKKHLLQPAWLSKISLIATAGESVMAVWRKLWWRMLWKQCNGYMKMVLKYRHIY